MILDWDHIAKRTTEVAKKMGEEYHERIVYEHKEIIKQGANEYWIELLKSKQKFEHNENGLVLPFILKMTTIDPIANGIEHNVSYQADFPDIDTDFLPYARDEIKRFASEQYGDEKVCTVGNWNTFKLKQALQDACRVLGGDVNEVIRLTKMLNDEEYESMDAEDIGQACKEFDEYYRIHKEIVDLALELRGRIKSQGQHAGGIIISSMPLEDTIPMSYIKGKYVSQWTEGMAATQLSPFGLVKFDILGLKTMAYNVYTEELIEKARNIKICWDECDPSCAEPYAGHMTLPDGDVVPILFNDEEAMATAHEVRTEAVFQFDTHVAKGVLSNGVTNFHDLVAYTALARPGPMEMIPEYVKRRDDPDKLWMKKEDPRVIDMLRDTHGIIVYQEQLTKFWTTFGGLTVPEAEKARKSVAKKKKEEVLKLGPKLVAGMIKSGFLNDPKQLTDDGVYENAKSHSAQGWWNKMVTFGRYCFNKSHAYAYGVIAYRALWLKTHFPPEYWASILTYCHQDKRAKYIGVAKLEGVEFKPVRAGYFHDRLVVDKNLNVYPSLTMIKGIGDSVAEALSDNAGSCTDVDNFVEIYGKRKGPMERLIKLGAFDDLHPKMHKAIWFWYQYKYASKNEENTTIKQIYNEWYLENNWPKEKLESERARQVSEYKKRYPKKKRIPISISNWNPKFGPKHDKPTREEFTEFFINLWSQDSKGKDKYFYKDWTEKEKMKFEKDYLGVYWTSPLVLYHHNFDYTFIKLKEHSIMEDTDRLRRYVDVVVEKIAKGVTKNGTKFTNVFCNDGVETQSVRIWGDAWDSMDVALFVEGSGIRMTCDWSDKYQNFNFSRKGIISALKPKEKEDVSS